MDTTIEYNAAFHSLHGASATSAGVAITAGFMWQGVLSKTATSRIICLYLAVISFAFPVLMLKMPNYHGLIQRLLYLQILGWIMVRHPEEIRSNKAR